MIVVKTANPYWTSVVGLCPVSPMRPVPSSETLISGYNGDEEISPTPCLKESAVAFHLKPLKSTSPYLNSLLSLRSEYLFPILEDQRQAMRDYNAIIMRIINLPQNSAVVCHLATPIFSLARARKTPSNHHGARPRSASRVTQLSIDHNATCEINVLCQ
ncbi:jg27175 [Pararge aegeria aegeria]|uniref:Jg27175 protein n=1 Tax=Pararge aegeria aegeria TaxID=348720 RepID=A0A8S4SR44_9NEOP|nr:jg27175 [Pararge aegeria aegeria]